MQRNSKRRLKHKNRLLVRYIFFLSFLLSVSAGLTLWTASLRVPAPAAMGHELTRPEGKTGLSRPTAPFSFAVYNIHRARGTDGKRDIERIAAVLADMDVVGLIELAGPSLTGAPDQAEQLGRRLNMSWLFAPNQRRWYRDHFGNGCLSRLPVHAWHNEPLPYDKDTSQSFRNLLTLHTRISGTEIAVLITHLDWAEMRSAQLSYVLDRFQRYPNVILLGDLNSTADDPQLTQLLAAPDVRDAIGTHLGERDDPERVDWIIVRGLTYVSGGVHSTGPSDHPCYWVDLDVE